MVIRKPSRKPSDSITQSFFDRVMQVPTRSPMGVMASSAPREKNVMPTISRTPPIRNAMRILGGIGAMVKLSSSTMPIIGSTAFRDSSSFSCSLVL